MKPSTNFVACDASIGKGQATVAYYSGAEISNKLMTSKYCVEGTRTETNRK